MLVHKSHSMHTHRCTAFSQALAVVFGPGPSSDPAACSHQRQAQLTQQSVVDDMKVCCKHAQHLARNACSQFCELDTVGLYSHWWTCLLRCLHADLWLLCLQRVMDVRYSWPSNLQLTQECMDMMNKIFVSSPEQRINIAGIQSHPWFTKDLPDELKVWRTGRQLDSRGLSGVLTERAFV